MIKQNEELIERVEKNIRIYYIGQFLLVFSFTMPHAILTPILLTKGILINQIALIQFFYNLAMLIFEIPSGIVADRISRKKTFICSLVCLFIAFFIILKFNSLYILCLAWFVYGLSQALNTGTLDSDMINSIKSYKKDYYKPFFKNSNYLALIGSIVGSGFGFLLYRIIDINIYLISLSLIIIVSILIILGYKEIATKKAQNIKLSDFKDHFLEALEEVKENRFVKYSIIALAILQFYLQFHFHYWQALFLENNISKDYFYLMYILFQLLNIFVYKIDIEKFDIKKIFLVFCISLVSIFLQILLKGKLIYIILYFAVLVFFMIVSYLSNYLLNKHVSQERISAIVSFNSTIQRIVAATSLLIYALVLRIFSIKYSLTFVAFLILLLEFYLSFKILKFNEE
ncbi:MAG: MFS transporter [Peptoniphilaceae bacterium]|nr:MFS transporter [Peptoniphilaceae bacterium]MDY6019745.1 MFS transporter [Anaerococcus sp.]